ncbi:MAG: hypothetical protein DRN17_02405 [Thermoplasmata archaeon]|nr:MAG: hypothetical protein DRN17_02405 [Thermoplasmata archaeon]
MHRASVVIESERSDVIYNAIKQETAPRANVSIDFDGKSLKLEISSENATNLRAALNSFLKWADLVDKIGDVVSR